MSFYVIKIKTQRILFDRRKFAIFSIVPLSMSNSDIYPKFRYRGSKQVVSVRFTDIEIVRIDDVRYHHVQVRVVEKMDILFGYFSLP